MGPLLRAAAQADLEAEAPIHDSVAGREGDPQAEGRRQREARALRLPGRVRPAFRRDRPRGRRAAGGPAEDLPGQPADGRAPDGGGDGRQPSSIRAKSNCQHMVVAGYKFTLERHFNGDGAYVVYERRARGADRAATCAPAEGRLHLREPLHLHSRPPCRSGRRAVTPKPIVQGTQTAVVVGPSGRGDLHRQVRPREGAVPLGPRGQERREQLLLGPRRRRRWAGQTLGGDPHPAHRAGGHRRLPRGRPGPADHRRQRLQRRHDAALRRCPTTRRRAASRPAAVSRGRPTNFNEIRFEDKKGHEQLFIHAEKNQDIEVENDETHWVGHDRTKTIDHDETTHVKHDRTETVDNNETITIAGNRTETVGQERDDHDSRQPDGDRRQGRVHHRSAKIVPRRSARTTA